MENIEQQRKGIKRKNVETVAQCHRPTIPEPKKNISE